MKWTRRFFALGLALALSAGVSCTTSDGPTGASVSQPAELGGLLEGDGLVAGDGPIGDVVDGAVGTVLGVTDLLVCKAQPYVVARKTVGPEGGSLTIGRHRLEIPRGALASRVTITGEQVSGAVNSVRLSPEGLRFAKPARLTLSYRNCGSVRLPKRVAYTNELLRILELPPSRDYRKYEYVTGAIDHFSRYAVAF
jgi:hypothetical protein